jgi:RNA polymerase sigma-70 factor (ECF subfamily)
VGAHYGRLQVGEAEIGRIFREEYGRSVAAVTRAFGDLDVAEDAVQEAFLIALRKWPEIGVPPNPGGWITITARNRALDGLRRQSRGRELLHEYAQASSHDREHDMNEEDLAVPDERLRLIFTCCHPALSSEAQVAMTLRLLGGLSAEDVARAFLVSDAAMAQRLARAKRKIKAARIPYRVPEDYDMPDRLAAVLAVLYLIYTAGQSRHGGQELCTEAIRLTRILAGLMPDEPEVLGLLALLLFTESRRPSRTRADGALVVLGEQDRTLWNHALIWEAHALVRRCAHFNMPGPYQLQAAINAVHAEAATFAQTDWPRIVELYEVLFALTPTPVVALNRAIAIGEVSGSAAALTLVDLLDLDGYSPWHATRADLLHRLGRNHEAQTAYERAAELAPTDAEREFLRRGGRTPVTGAGTAAPRG